MDINTEFNNTNRNSSCPSSFKVHSNILAQKKELRGFVKPCIDS